MNKNTGFTLIEVLIAMLVLAIGLLGLAALQATGLKNNLSAYTRSQATQLAYDMSDRMRANRADTQNLAASTYVTVVPTVAVAKANCEQVANACSAVDMAENDLFIWNNAITTVLPMGQGTIALNGSIYTITINWDDNRDGNRDLNFQMSFQL